MKTVTFREIERSIYKVSPDMLDWNPTDKEYALVDMSEVPSLIDSFPTLPWKENKWECEEIARCFVCDVRRWEASMDMLKYNRAVGVAFCSLLEGQEMQHTLNIIITPAGPVLADLQTKQFRFAEEGKDEIYFVEM